MTIKVAAIQAAPVLFDLGGSTAKAVTLAREAASNGAELVVFPELFLPGYAWWLWTETYMTYHPRIAPYTANCPEVGGKEYRQLRDLAIELGVYLVIGAAERHGGSLYMSQWIFGPQGLIANRRKLKPTAVERVLYGEGDGSDIKVHDTPIGRLGALNCWEHAQPLVKHVMACQDEAIHCASWPTFFPEDAERFLYGVMPTMYKATCRSYALEVGCFVISATSPYTVDCINTIAGSSETVRQSMQVGGGSSLILDPQGRDLATPLDPTAEGIMYAVVDLSERHLARSALDTVGHYSRPDVFKVLFDPRPKQVVVVGGHGSEPQSGVRKLRDELFGRDVRSSDMAHSESSWEGNMNVV